MPKGSGESLVCGACGQLGHMRTNKNCPKYGEDLESRVENADAEKTSGKLNSSDQIDQPPQRASTKKFIQKSATKIAVIEAHEDEKFTLKGKIKCGTTDKLPKKREQIQCASGRIHPHSDNLGVGVCAPKKLTPATSNNSEKLATSDAEKGKSVVKVNKIVFSNQKKQEDMLGQKRPPTEFDKEQPRKKIIIKKPKEIISVDDVSQEGSTGFEYRKTKKNH